MPNHVIPTKDEDFLPWLANFAGKLVGYAVLLGVTPAQLSQLAADHAFFAWIMGCMVPVDAAKQQFTAAKNLARDGGTIPADNQAPVLPVLTAAPAPVPPGIVPRCAALIAIIRQSPNFTDAIGEDLRLMTTPPTVLTHPTGHATALPGSQVELTWVKGTHQAVIVESQVGSETAWASLGPKMSKPFIDTHAPQVAGQPEVRRYRLRFMDHDEPVGDFSDCLR